uniref:DNA-directed RNA polymerase n=1 Tax=Petromyzon marinus TaxID=7757 RepID=A0AAJ7SLD8_PETMA|nr:DNA-directed RNA polymerase I subunit RPA1-like [Petromyzon marinus]
MERGHSGGDALRISAVLSAFPAVEEYSYDGTEHRWCRVVFKLPVFREHLDVSSLVTALSRRSVVREVPGIVRGLLTEEAVEGVEAVVDAAGGAGGPRRLVLHTEGVNLGVIMRHAQILDMSRLYTNDVHAMCGVFGVEAALRVVEKEIRGVFAVYGIQVDPRHLSLVADYMFYEGTYLAFSRLAMRSSSSPLQQMTYETSMAFLKTAAMMGSWDELRSPSASLVVGQLVRAGTGLFELKQPLA